MTLKHLLSLLRLSVADPLAGGQRLLAMNPPMPARWLMLAAAVLVSVVVLYALPGLTGDISDMPTPFSFAATQGALNLVVILLITHVGRGFGGTGSFAGALWLMGWLQVLTAALLLVQIAALLVLPFLSMLVGIASVAVSIWVMVGYICALHGFTSRVMVLVGGIMTLVVFSFVLSVILLILGFGPAELANV